MGTVIEAPQKLVLERLSFAYPDAPVFREVSTTIPLTGLSQVVGPNGGGKSTLAKLIAGLVRPTMGRVSLDDSPVDQWQNRIGYVPQLVNFDRSFPILVKEVVLSGCLSRWWGPYSREDRRRAAETLERLDLAPLASRPFSALSGGQRQRVLIGRALVSEPALVILDEPTANIDYVSSQTMAALLTTLKSTCPVLLITHDFGFLAHQVDRVVCVNRSIHVHGPGPLSTEGLRGLFTTHFDELALAGGPP